MDAAMTEAPAATDAAPARPPQIEAAMAEEAQVPRPAAEAQPGVSKAMADLGAAADAATQRKRSVIFAAGSRQSVKSG